MSLKIASIILPKHANDRTDLAFVHDGLTIELIDHFGGYTAYPVVGAWQNDLGRTFRDSNVKYEIAIDTKDAFGDRQLLELARRYAALAAQEMVFVQTTDGNVHFVKGSPQPSTDGTPSLTTPTPNAELAREWHDLETGDLHL